MEIAMMRETLEKCLAHYLMMEKIFYRKSRGDTVKVGGKIATYEDFAKEMRAGADACFKALEDAGGHGEGRQSNPVGF
jgi:hypothetical protein